MTARVRAPELRGRGWLNTGGKDLTLADLRGKIVLLDFWTFCCINCLHVLDELRPLEEKYGDALVVIGVHSPKFEHERDPEALAAAVERYGVHHPVVDDGDMHLWQQYAAKAWPTLAVVDPTGYLVASMAGEGHAEGLSRLIDELVVKHEADGTLHRGDGPYVPPPRADTLLRFPGKAIELPGRQPAGLRFGPALGRRAHPGRRDAGPPVRRRRARRAVQRAAGPGPAAAGGRRGGRLRRGRRRHRQPPAPRPPPGDRRDHPGGRLGRSVALRCGRPRTDALAADLSSPWDLAWFDDKVIVAMAGIHQLWWFDPIKRTVGVYAGTTVEALRDGPLPDVWMAQPSGLSAAGDRLWIADSETSALRYIEDGVLHTAVGQGLFDFGHVDGPRQGALLQHPLGVAALPDGSVLIADTYNGAVRRYDPATGEVSTVDSGLAEPSDILVTAAGDVLVVESAAHRLTRLAPGVVKTVTGERHKTERPASPLAPGELTLDVVFTPAPGQKLDTQFGPSTRLDVSASPPELLLDGAGVTTDLSRRLVINPAVPKGVLQVVAQAATCDVDAEFAACHLTRQDWGVPVRGHRRRPGPAAADPARPGRVLTAVGSGPLLRLVEGVDQGAASSRPARTRAASATAPGRVAVQADRRDRAGDAAAVGGPTTPSTAIRTARATTRPGRGSPRRAASGAPGCRPPGSRGRRSPRRPRSARPRPPAGPAPTPAGTAPAAPGRRRAPPRPRRRPGPRRPPRCCRARRAASRSGPGRRHPAERLQRPDLVEDVVAQLVEVVVDPAAAEAGQVAIADLRADRDTLRGRRRGRPGASSTGRRRGSRRPRSPRSRCRAGPRRRPAARGRSPRRGRR